jgi:hypothetical protein
MSRAGRARPAKQNRCGFERPYRGRRSGAALRRGSAPARRPTLSALTFLNWEITDISIWARHVSPCATRIS